MALTEKNKFSSKTYVSPANYAKFSEQYSRSDKFNKPDINLHKISQKEEKVIQTTIASEFFNGIQILIIPNMDFIL